MTRKREVVLRVLRGESIEALSRELGIESYRIQEWFDRALASLDAGLRERGGDPLEDQLKRAHAVVGELTMMNELYQERLRRIEHRPFDPKRSRK
ncbi:MAG TPA: IS3 family transposase [Candidatus Hydrogenedentes bacterium]|nr:IS3 family transposase [Candidatus Hydrogenedentota bacterium]